MATRSLNKVQLIGNLTRDPELRYTPQGNAVCTFGLATNRQWTTDTGEKKEEADFHRVVAWNKLAEICSQLLSKGRRVYVEGRLSTRSWTAPDGSNRQTTEIVAQDLIFLDRRPEEIGVLPEAEVEAPPEKVEGAVGDDASAPAGVKKSKKQQNTPSDQTSTPEDEEIPF